MFRPNPNFARELAHTPETRHRLRVAAETVEGHASRFSRTAGGPWMLRKGQDNFTVQTDESGVYLVNTDHAAHLLEWGSIQNPPHAPLRRAVRASGLRLQDL